MPRLGWCDNARIAARHLSMQLVRHGGQPGATTGAVPVTAFIRRTLSTICGTGVGGLAAVPNFRYAPALGGTGLSSRFATLVLRECSTVSFSGQRLAQRRVAAGLTQAQLAKLVHSEQSRVSDWERGAATPRSTVAPALAAAVGATAVELVADDAMAPTLRDLRVAAGMTTGVAADRLGISQRRYRGIESGSTRRPPADVLVKSLAEAFDVPVQVIRQALAARM